MIVNATLELVFRKAEAALSGNQKGRFKTSLLEEECQQLGQNKLFESDMAGFEEEASILAVSEARHS